MKLKWIWSALFATALCVPALAQLSVYVGSAPPPLRYEERQPSPGEGYAWVDGYWAPHGRHYQWIAGRWDRAPYEGAYWNHPHYDHYQQGWQMHEGHWDHDNHDEHARDNGHDRGHDHENENH